MLQVKSVILYLKNALLQLLHSEP